MHRGGRCTRKYSRSAVSTSLVKLVPLWAANCWASMSKTSSARMVVRLVIGKDLPSRPGSKQSYAYVYHTVPSTVDTDRRSTDGYAVRGGSHSTLEWRPHHRTSVVQRSRRATSSTWARIFRSTSSIRSMFDGSQHAVVRLAGSPTPHTWKRHWPYVGGASFQRSCMSAKIALSSSWSPASSGLPAWLRR